MLVQLTLPAARLPDRISTTVKRATEMKAPTLHVVLRAVSTVFIPGILAAFVATMLIVGGTRLDALGVLGLTYGGIVIVTVGLVLIIWTIGESASSRFAMAILLGSITTSLFLTGGCLLTGCSAGTLFIW
jgi:hypothetical protein